MGQVWEISFDKSSVAIPTKRKTYLATNTCVLC